MGESEEVVPSPTLSDGRLPTGEYEFTPAQNEVLADLGSNLRTGGWGVIILVAVYHAVLLGRWAAGGPPMYDRFRLSHIWWPLMAVIFAAAFISAGRAFGRVVATQGRDITHLMSGLKSLNEFFSWLPLTWVFLVIAALVGAVVAVVHLLGY